MLLRRLARLIVISNRKLGLDIFGNYIKLLNNRYSIANKNAWGFSERFLGLITFLPRGNNNEDLRY